MTRQAEYITRIRQGEQQLIPELWELLRPLTARFIRRYIMQGRGERLYSKDDLWQESYIALVAALDYWKPEKGAFSSVYLWAIQNATRASRGEVSPDAIFKADSLDKPLDSEGDSDTTRGDMVEDERAGQGFEDAEHKAYLDALRCALAEIDAGQLTDEQRAVIRARYHDGLSLISTAERLGVPVEDCKSAESKAMRVYRKPQNSARLKPFYVSYSGTGLGAFRQQQASCVELAVERLERLGTLANQVKPERRARWEREREQAEAMRQWGGYAPESVTKSWARYIECGGDRPMF